MTSRSDQPVGLPADILELEKRHLLPGGEPTLGLAFDRLLDEWRRGSRDREVTLHLLFVAWSLLCEPPFLTGRYEARTPGSAIAPTFREVLATARDTIATDAEMTGVVGLMASVFPDVLGDSREFEALAVEYHASYRTMAPNGIPPEVFAGRGVYGSYFAHHANCGNL